MGTSASNPDAPPPPQAVAAANFQYPQQPHPYGAAAAPAGQTLTRDQLRTLMRNGLDADLALNHFQMPRASAAPLLSAPAAAGAQQQQTVTLRNAMNLRRPTLRLVRCTTAGANTGIATASSASPLYAVRFVFDAECRVRVTVRFACTELVEALPPTAGVGGGATVTATATATVGFAADERVYAPRTYDFGAGANQLFEQPTAHALDVSRLSPAQLTAVPAQRYFPLVVTLTKIDAAAALDVPDAPVAVAGHDTAGAAAAAGAGADHKSEAAGAGASAGDGGGGGGGSGGSGSSGSSGAANEVVCQSTFAAFVAVNATTLDVKALKQTIALASGVTFELHEIFGLEPKPAVPTAAAAAGSAAAVAAGAKAASASSGAAECVVCLSAARSTTVMPCRHMCLCTDCATVLRGQERARCPICRSPVESLLVLNLKPTK